jgi:hypothetical protein
MKNRLKSVVATGLFVASLLSLTSCSLLNELEKAKSAAAPDQLLPLSWRDAEVTWTENVPIRHVASLPRNIAYVAKRSEGDEFLMYDPDGKAMVRLGVSAELPDAKEMTVVAKFVDGKTYLTVFQGSGTDFVATGFDESGKEIFRRVEADRSSAEFPDLDPITGKNYYPSGETSNMGRSTKVIRVIDGVEIRAVYDSVTNRRYISGPGWERETFQEGSRKSYLTNAGRYLCVSLVTESSHTSELVDVHTGKEVAVDGAITSCLNDAEGVVDGQIVTSRSKDVLSPIADKHGLDWRSETGDGASYLIAPDMGRGWDYSVKSDFLPYSFDPIGRVYGYIVSDGEFISGAMDADDPRTLIVLKGNPRSPIAITGSGIGVFPSPDFENLALVQDGADTGETVFAVKKPAVTSQSS